MRPSRHRARVLFVTACVLAVTGPRAQPADYELLIRNGRVLDGTGNPFYICHVVDNGGHGDTCIRGRRS